jgi:hypothetical protein
MLEDEEEVAEDAEEDGEDIEEEEDIKEEKEKEKQEEGEEEKQEEEEELVGDLPPMQVACLKYVVLFYSPNITVCVKPVYETTTAAIAVPVRALQTNSVTKPPPTTASPGSLSPEVVPVKIV